MKNITKKFLAAFSGVAIIAAYAVLAPAAFASVSLISGPTSPITSPLVLAANSGPTVIFSFSLNATSGETVSSVAVEIDKANSATGVTGTHFASLAVYKDNGDGIFNTTSDSLIGSQGTVNINSPTVISTNYYSATASGEFFVTLATSASWTATSPADSITATMPVNSIVTSANSPSITPVTTPMISASSSNLTPTAITQQLSATGNIAINQGVYDTASLSNTNGTAGGSITYNVYLGALCSGPVTFSDNEPVNFSVTNPSRPFSTTATGTYSWQAMYSGDVSNTNATSSCASEFVDPTPGTTIPTSPVTPPSSLPVTGIPAAALGLIALSGVVFAVKKLSFN